MTSTHNDSPGFELVEFLSGLQFDDLPRHVVERVQWLFLDWYGSALAGGAAPGVRVFEKLARDMGPPHGPCRLFASDHTTSALFAAMVNGAASHVVEQDDLHNSSVLHPGAVVFPPVFALAQHDPGLNGRDLVTAVAAGYESGIRVGEFLGRSHYRVFHTTATAGTVAAAMASARLLGLDPVRMNHALGSAGTQAAGLWEFLRDAADSKQLHTAKACCDGLLAAWTARDGLTAASRILDGERGMAAGMLGEGDPARLNHALGSRWALTETSFKYHASCRHTHPAADALLNIRDKYDLDWKRIESVTAYVYRAAADVLGAVDVPATIHQSKFSMGFVLALIARYGSAGVGDFSGAALADPDNAALRARVRMQVDEDIDRRYPEVWASRVEVVTRDGEVLVEQVDTPRGDPGAMLSRQELEDKFTGLAGFAGVDPAAADAVLELAWRLPELDSVAAEFSSAAMGGPVPGVAVRPRRAHVRY